MTLREGSVGNENKSGVLILLPERSPSSADLRAYTSSDMLFSHFRFSNAEDIVRGLVAGSLLLLLKLLPFPLTHHPLTFGP